MNDLFEFFAPILTGGIIGVVFTGAAYTAKMMKQELMDEIRHHKTESGPEIASELTNESTSDSKQLEAQPNDDWAATADWISAASGDAAKDL